MAVLMVLTLALTTQESARQHVRTDDSRILALIDAGIAGSPTFRGLVATLNESDVIVYIVPKATRKRLGGYLAHNIASQGGYRYVRIAIGIAGHKHRLVPVLAHELQHAVEVAQAPDARDQQGLKRLFGRLAVGFGCDTNCFETNAARDVEDIVRGELADSQRRSQVR